MVTPLKIRIAGIQDAHLLAELGARTFADSFAADNTPDDMAAYLAKSFSPEKQAAEMAEPGTVFLIAEEGGKPVGYTRLRERIVPECVGGQHPVEIVRLYSVKEMIGRGVGAALMESCVSEAASRGCDIIWLDVWEKNPRAIAFYRKWGFEKVGEQGFQLGDDLQTDWLMARPTKLER